MKGNQEAVSENDENMVVCGDYQSWSMQIMIKNGLKRSGPKSMDTSRNSWVPQGMGLFFSL